MRDFVRQRERGIDGFKEREREGQSETDSGGQGRTRCSLEGVVRGEGGCPQLHPATALWVASSPVTESELLASWAVCPSGCRRGCLSGYAECLPAHETCSFYSFHFILKISFPRIVLCFNSTAYRSNRNSRGVQVPTRRAVWVGEPRCEITGGDVLVTWKGPMQTPDPQAWEWAGGLSTSPWASPPRGPVLST